MRISNSSPISLLGVIVFAASCSSMSETVPTEVVTVSSPIASVTALELGPNNQLFIADSYGGRIYTVDLGSRATPEAAHFNISDVDGLIAEHLGVSVLSLTFTDLVLLPSYEAVIGLSYMQDAQRYGFVASVSLNGEVTLVDLEGAESIEIPAPHTEDVIFWRDHEARVLSVTDMDYFEDKLYVAGLSNGDFASILYTFPVPFDGTASTTSVEIYHAVHNQIETRAPIRTQTILNLDGVPHLFAAYTCTPVVTIPITDLVDGAHITGKTIAEVGYGNTPVDVMKFDAQGQDGSTQSFVLMTNRERSTMLFPLPAIAASAQAEGLSEPIDIATTESVGTPFFRIPMAGVQFIADQDGERLVAIRRDPTTGRMELVSFLKNIYFRLSDHWSEYNFPSYQYPSEQEGTANFQGYMKQSEGYDPTKPAG